MSFPIHGALLLCGLAFEAEIVSVFGLRVGDPWIGGSRFGTFFLSDVWLSA